MLKVKPVWLGVLLGLTLSFGGATYSGATIEPQPDAIQNIHERSADLFQVISQPLEVRLGVVLASVALIGVELWWFLLKKPIRK